MTKFGKVLSWVAVLLVVFGVVYLLQKQSPVLAPEEIEENVSERMMEGNFADLVSFSILPNSKVSGVVPYNGAIKGAYFFEANILINVLDQDKNVLLNSNAMATTEWMTVEPVSFEGNIDFTNLPKGPAYIEIHNDNASGLPENDKSVLVPIIIE